MLSPDEVRQLDRLTFGNPSAAPATTLSGARMAKVRGFSSEFHDFRPYQPGDDPRSVEWTIYGRLGQLMTRTYRTHAQFKLHLLLDVSASMGIGVPDKLGCGTKLAALLCYVAMRTRDAVGLATFTDGIIQRLAPSDGRSQLFRIFAALSKVTAYGRSAIDDALMKYGSVERGPGLVVVISDFFDSNGVLEGLRYLQHGRLTPAVVQILSGDEVDPPFLGEAELVDVERPEAPPLLLDARSVTAYQAALAEHRASLREFCDTHALPFLQLSPSDSFADVLRACSRAGLFVAKA